MNLLLNKTIIGIAIILLLVAYSTYQTKRANTQEALKEEAFKSLELAEKTYQENVEIEKKFSFAQGQAQANKKAVVKNTKALEKAIQKRGEIKNEDDSNFTVFSF
jgi:ABC-type enterobactin transport system permease subunit